MNLKDLITKMHAIDEGIEIIGGPPGLPGISHPPEQQDNVTMNVSINGSGAGGVRDLMNILHNIEKGEEPTSHISHDKGGEEEPLIGDMLAHMEQEMADAGEESPLSMPPEETEVAEVMGDDNEHWGNAMSGDAGHHVHGVDAVTFSGDDMNSKGKLSPVSRAPGTNAMRHPMHEQIAERLQSLYNTIKEERTEEKDDKGNVVRWKDEGEWTKKSNKSGRGKVTNLSDKARRETEKLSKKEKEVAEASHQEKTTMKHVKNPTQGEKDAAKKIKPGIPGIRDRFDMLKSAEKDGRLDESVQQMLALNKILNG